MRFFKNGKELNLKRKKKKEDNKIESR